MIYKGKLSFYDTVLLDYNTETKSHFCSRLHKILSGHCDYAERAAAFLALRAAPDFLLAFGLMGGWWDALLPPLLVTDRCLGGGKTQTDVQKNQSSRQNVKTNLNLLKRVPTLWTHPSALWASLRGHTLRLCSRLPQLKQPSFPSARPHGWSGRAQRPQAWQCRQA